VESTREYVYFLGTLARNPIGFLLTAGDSLTAE